MIQPRPDADTKFVESDLPIIHATIERARRARSVSKITIDIDQHGGVTGILLETKQKVK